MYQESLDFKQNTHLLGVTYLSNYLAHVGFTIVEVNTDPDHHYQLLVKVNDKTLLIAVRTDHYPKSGTIDTWTMEKLLRESEKLNAIPHFAGLTLVPDEAVDNEADGASEEQKYRVIFNGITAVRRSELPSTEK